MHYIDMIKLTNFANAFVHQLSGVWNREWLLLWH